MKQTHLRFCTKLLPVLVAALPVAAPDGTGLLQGALAQSRSRGSHRTLAGASLLS